MTNKESKYNKILESKNDEEMIAQFMEYLYLDDVIVSSSDEIELIRKILFDNKTKTWLHILTTEMIINSITVSGVDNNQKNYRKYLKILSKYSMFLNTLSMLYLDDMIDDIMRVHSHDIVQDIINSLEGEVQIAIIRRLVEMPYWRNALPKLELYDTFL